MQSVLLTDASSPSADVVSDSAPTWSSFESQRQRTLLFLLCAAVYVGYHLVARWVYEPLFNGDWYYFGGEPPPWYNVEFLYRWFLTILPLAAWVGALFFLLTRVRFLAHRRVAIVAIL